MTNLKKEKVTKSTTINTTLLNVIKYWLFLLRSRHQLQKKQEELLSLIIYQYIMFSKEVSNPKFIWKLVFDYDSRQEISEIMNISNINFENYLTRMRNNNVIIDNQVNPNYMPGIGYNTKEFNLQFNFNIIDKNETKR